MLKVLHVISGIEPENGGPTAVIKGLLTSLAQVGVNVELAATWKSQSAFSTAEILKGEGVPVHLVGPANRRLQRHPDTPKLLAELCARFDLVHIHATWEDIQHKAALAAAEAHRPYIWTPHGMLDQWSLSKKRFIKSLVLHSYLRKALNGASLIHAASSFEETELRKLRLKPPISVQGFGIDDALMATLPKRDLWRSGTPMAETDAPLMLFLGRIKAGKGLELLIPAMALMSRKDAVLLVAGPDEGGHRSHVQELIDKHGLRERVRFLGMVTGERKASVLQDVQVLAAPSEHENFGIAVAEALAVGTQVVVSDQVGVGSILSKVGAGKVVPLNASAVAAALDEAVGEELVAGEAARAARRTAACAALAWTSVAEGFRSIYESVLVNHK